MAKLKRTTQLLLGNAGKAYRKTGSTFSKNARKDLAGVLRGERKKHGSSAVRKRFIDIAKRRKER